MCKSNALNNVCTLYRNMISHSVPRFFACNYLVLNLMISLINFQRKLDKADQLYTSAPNFFDSNQVCLLLISHQFITVLAALSRYFHEALTPMQYLGAVIAGLRQTAIYNSLYLQIWLHSTLKSAKIWAGPVISL